MTTSWYVIFVTMSEMNRPGGSCSAGAGIVAVMKMSIVWPGVRMPATARSSGIVMEMARHASESGATVSSGSRMEMPDLPVVSASMFE